MKKKQKLKQKDKYEVLDQTGGRCQLLFMSLSRRLDVDVLNLNLSRVYSGVIGKPTEFNGKQTISLTKKYR